MKYNREVWEKIPNTTNMFVSNIGRILSMRDGNPKILQCKINEKGYLRVVIKGKAVFVHRIVAEVFLGKPKEGQTQINHKNGKTGDNRAINIEWCTPGENLQHSYDVLGRKGSWEGKKRGPIPEEQKKRQIATLKKYYDEHKEARERLSKITSEMFSLGNNPRAIKTICYETGEVFSCGKEAAIKYGVKLSSISQSIHKGFAVKGKYHFYQEKQK